MKPRVFVVMPFGLKEVQHQPPLEADFDALYDQLIGPALEQAGCEPFRADRENAAGDIRTDMFFELVTADAVLADISILNANVFYELGVRHGVAPRGVLTIHGGWSRVPFDVAPDRTFPYNGKLFLLPREQDAEWEQCVQAEAARLGRVIKAALDTDEQVIGSPVYKELSGLKPVDWSEVHTARARYFRGVLDDWRARVRVARRTGYSGDILTLAGDAPTRLHREKLLLEAARSLIDLRRFEAARSVLDEVLELTPDNFEARCQTGLVLGRIGRIEEAEQLISGLAREFPDSAEAQGILGRIYKDMWRLRWESYPELIDRQRAAVRHSAFAATAVDSYAIAHRRSLNSYYNGINTLTLLELLNHLKIVTGEQPHSTAVFEGGPSALHHVVGMAARQARDQAREVQDREEAVWATGTLAELALLAGDRHTALRYYRDAVMGPDSTYFQVESILQQLRILDGLGFRPEIVRPTIQLVTNHLDTFANPGVQVQYEKVAVFSGHMIDRPDRPVPRFPHSKEGVVRDSLARQLDEWGIGTGHLAICGAARGGDILFAELCLARGAEVRLFLAVPENEYVARSVRLPRTNWEDRYFDLLDRCKTFDQCQRLGPPPDGMSPFERNNLWIVNTARVEAKPRRIYAALVWDEKPAGDGPGGTAHFAATIQRIGGRLCIVNPTTV